ncbi:MAG: hypothetical protein LBB27_04430 [Tannerellaceae bacterium]|jgi:RNase P/RNase MRP subunit POP5|nr:hypothetical protein [Tannerellaceae bacterium]
MHQQEDVFRRFRESLARADGRIHLMSNAVSAEMRDAWFHAVRRECMTRRRFGQIEVSEAEIEEAFQALCSEVNGINEKKHAIVVLVVSGSIKALRRLETFAATAEGELADWLQLAVSDLSVRLQTELLGEPHMLIASGLGAKDDKLRFFALFSSNGDAPFEAWQQRFMEKEFTYILSEKGCEIDILNVGERHVELLFLVPLATDCFSILAKLIEECNEYGHFLSPRLFVSNAKRMAEEEIQQWKRSDKP